MMDEQTEMALIINDLKSIHLRIEALPPHRNFTEARSHIIAARVKVSEGQNELYQSALNRRYDV